MNARVIKVKFADRAKDGKKQCTIKTADNEVYGVWPDKFGLLQPGKTYRIEFSEREFNGKTYRTIVKCEPTEVEERTNDRATTPQRSSPSHKEAETEFVTRLLCASIQACAVGHKESDLTAEAKMLRSVYRSTFNAG